MRDALERLVQLCSPFFPTNGSIFFFFFNTLGFLLKLILFFNSVLIFLLAYRANKSFSCLC